MPANKTPVIVEFFYEISHRSVRWHFEINMKFTIYLGKLVKSIRQEEPQASKLKSNAEIFNNYTEQLMMLLTRAVDDLKELKRRTHRELLSKYMLMVKDAGLYTQAKNQVGGLNLLKESIKKNPFTSDLEYIKNRYNPEAKADFLISQLTEFIQICEWYDPSVKEEQADG